MEAYGQKIILVAFNRNGNARDTGTVLSVGSGLELLVMGSGPLSFCIEGKGGSCLEEGNPVSELLIRTRALFQSCGVLFVCLSVFCLF